MKTLKKTCILLCMLLIQNLNLLAQVDCNTAAGVFALMASPAVKGTPRNPDQQPLNPNNLPIRFSADMFLAQQSSATNMACFSKITYLLFASTNAVNLNNLPSLAATNDNFSVPANVRKFNVTIDNTVIGTGAVISGKLDISRSLYSVGSTVFYRIAKRIDNCSTCTGPDPYVFSTTYSFKVPPMPLIDASGNFYQIDTINGQIWMMENLRTTKYKNGALISVPATNALWSANTTGAVCSYSGTTPTASSTEYGGAFYNWYAATNAAGVCPTGWHVPTKAEWNALFAAVGGDAVAGGELKYQGVFDATGESGWSGNYNSPNTGCDGNSVFPMGIPASGLRQSAGNLSGFLNDAYLWASDAGSKPTHVRFTYDAAAASSSLALPKNTGMSIRCKKN